MPIDAITGRPINFYIFDGLKVGHVTIQPDII